MRENITLKLRIDELAEKLESGIDTPDVMQEYMPQWNVSKRTIERYIKLAKDKVAGRLKLREAVIEEVRDEIITREAEQWLKSTLELEAKLCAIVEGGIEMKSEVLSRNGEVKTLTRKSSVKEIIDAIDLLLKLRGMYKIKPEKQEGNRVSVIKVDNEREKELLERIRNQDKPATN